MQMASPAQIALWVSSSHRLSATAFVLTIEPAQDDDPAPSSVHVLGGNFVVDDAASAVAELTVGHPAALGDDFSTAAGSYILAASSGGEDPALC